MAITSWRLVWVHFLPARPVTGGGEYRGWMYVTDKDGNTVEFSTRDAAEQALAAEMSRSRGVFDTKYPPDKANANIWQSDGAPLMMVVPYDDAAYRRGQVMVSAAAGE